MTSLCQVRVIDVNDVNELDKTFRDWIINRYGSRRGAVRTNWHKLVYVFGVYRAYRKIDWDAVERLVFICKGNICRSAFAEAVAKPLGVDTISCGLDTVDGAPANAIALKVAKQFSMDLSNHQTMPIDKLKLKKTDLLIAMEPGQIKQLQLLYGEKYQYTLLGLWTRPSLPHLQDPYGSSPIYFQRCFNSIEKSVQQIANNCTK